MEYRWESRCSHLFSPRYIILKAAWRIVRKTDAEWDNEILDPLFNRVYIFVLTAGVELTMMWTLGRNDAFLHRRIALLLRIHTPERVYNQRWDQVHSARCNGEIQHQQKRNSDRREPHRHFRLEGHSRIHGNIPGLQEVGIELLGILASLAVFSAHHRIGSTAD